MKMGLHHFNWSTTNVDFCRNVMGLAEVPTLNFSNITNQGYSGETAFAMDGHVQVHISGRSPPQKQAKRRERLRAGRRHGTQLVVRGCVRSNVVLHGTAEAAGVASPPEGRHPIVQNGQAEAAISAAKSR